MQITLKSARVNAGLTQQQAADLGGVTRITIGKWERGTSAPNRLQLIGLASVYGVSVDSIIMPKRLAKR